MADYPGHPRDGNYNDPGYHKAVIIYFWTMLTLGIIGFILWIELSQ